MAMLTCRVSDELMKELAEEAERRGVQRSAVVVERLSRTRHELDDFAVASMKKDVAAKKRKPAVVPSPLVEALEAAASGAVEPVAVSRVPAVVAVVSDVVVPVEPRTAACPECGGMSGCHQRGCKRKGKA